jgi:ABC-type multidrug transport system fused ATPase/permease subunit
MTRLAGNKTILIVSHRLPIVAFADRIYVMLKGEIVEQGPTPSSCAARAFTRGCSASRI